MSLNVTIFHDANGDIFGVVKDPAPVTPAGLTALAKTVGSLAEVYNSKVRIGDNALVPRNYLELTPPGDNVIPVNTVKNLSFKKVNGDTDADMTSASDDDCIKADLRFESGDESDLGFLQDDQKDLIAGAASFRLAGPAMASEENIVLYNPKLQLLRLNVEYV
jgi:hypothetical protein